MNTIQNHSNSNLNFGAKLNIQDSEKLLSNDLVSKYSEMLKDYGNKNDEVLIRAFSDNRKNIGNSDKFIEGNVKINEQVVKSFGEKVISVGADINDTFKRIISDVVTPVFKK